MFHLHNKNLVGTLLLREGHHVPLCMTYHLVFTVSALYLSELRPPAAPCGLGRTAPAGLHYDHLQLPNVCREVAQVALDLGCMNGLPLLLRRSRPPGLRRKRDTWWKRVKGLRPSDRFRTSGRGAWRSPREQPAIIWWKAPGCRLRANEMESTPPDDEGMLLSVSCKE